MRSITRAAVSPDGAESKAASGYSDLTDRSGMISLDLPPGVVDPVPGGVSDHHVTVAYLGKSVTDDEFAQACERAQQAASRVPAPLTATLSGISSFPPDEHGKKPVYIPASIPGGDHLRNDLADLSASEHPGWSAHVTTHYDDADAPLPDPQPDKQVTFTHLSVHRGDDVRRFPFGGTAEAVKGAPGTLEIKTGPGGWSHNWVYHGVPGTGDHVHHPSHGKGVVTAATDRHVTVKFASGASRTFEHHKPPPGGKTGFVTRAEHESSQRAAGREAARAAASAAKPVSKARTAKVSADDRAAAVAKAKSIHEGEKARGAGHLHPLAKVGPSVTDAKGTTRSTAVDHEGREFRLKSNGNKVTVKHGEQSMSSSEARNPTLKAREMAGKLAGGSEKPKAPEPVKPLAPGLSQSYVAGKGATDADVAELSRRYEIMHGKKPSTAQLAKVERAKPAAATAIPAAGKPMPHHAATAHAIADDVRFERRLNGFQREEATMRLRSAGRNLSAGNHGDAVTDLDDATRAAGMPGGGVITGSVAARSRDLAAKVRADAPGHSGDAKAPAGERPVVIGPHPADKFAVASNPKATAKAMSTEDLHAADAELERRAAVLGKPGVVSKPHKAVRDELAQRNGATGNAKPAADANALSGDAAYDHVAEPSGKADRSAVSYYTNGANYRYNKPLRQGVPVTDKADAQRLRAMDAAFTRAPATTQPLTVHRGLDAHLFGNGDATGTEFTDKGFTSTSTDPAQAVEFGPEHESALMDIHVPAGSRVIKPGGAGNEVYQDEKELILNRGGRYKVTGDTMITHPKYGKIRKLTATYLGSA